MPSVDPTTKHEVLSRTAELLRTSDPSFANRTYIMCESGDPRDNIRDREFLTVSMAGGTFDYKGMVGGVIHYQSTIAVTLWQIDRKDRSGTDSSVLLDDFNTNKGLFPLEQAILKKLFLSCLDEGLNGADRNGILMEPLMPLNDSTPMRVTDEAFGNAGHRDDSRAVLSIDFGCKFKWDLR